LSEQFGSQEETEVVNGARTLTFAEFLESVPPSQAVNIDVIANNLNDILITPDIQLHCGSEVCNGTRFFRSTVAGRKLVLQEEALLYLSYRCANCRVSVKIFSLRVYLTDNQKMAGNAYKLGEYPVYGPPTAARLIKMVGPDRDVFLKGRRCENQGLGIGAFVYYRRVVENQKNRILDQIIKVATKIGAPEDSLVKLNDAKQETQFSKALASVRDAIPQSLLINGQNPLMLLHSALSEGLHDRTDEECLKIAQAVRIVLAELSDRLSQALKDEAELNGAVSRLTTLKK
jgi:hypothetical protein